MKQKAFIISKIIAFILCGCNNDRDKKLKIKPLNQLMQVDKLLSEIAQKPQQLNAPQTKQAK